MWKLFLISVLWIPLALQSALINVRVDENPVGPFDPVSGTVEIIHDPEEEVDPDSFTLEGEPLQVKFLEKEEAQDKMLSRFRFEIWPEGEGLQALGKISARVGGERAESVPTTYTATFKTPDSGLYLKGYVLGDKPFYPGERLKFVYKIYYLGNVELTKESLPLLEAEGFLKIGPLQVDESMEKGYRVQSFIQEVEARKPGDFNFEASLLEGLVNGVRKIQTTVEPFTLTISPFPGESKPQNFIGTGGTFEVSSRLQTSDKIMVGDKITATITFKGKGNLESVALPDIFCQPGISGFFAETETPAFATIDNGAVTFTVEMIPLTDLRQEIPSLVFSIYDAASEHYTTIQTQPIPMTIASPPIPKLSRPPVADVKKPKKDETDVKLVDEPARLPLTAPVSLFYFYLTLALACLIGLAQFLGKDSLVAFFSRKKEKSPREKLQEAARYDLNDRKFYLLAREAFLQVKSAKAKQFLYDLDAIRYGKLSASKDQVLKRAREAFP